MDYAYGPRAIEPWSRDWYRACARRCQVGSEPAATLGLVHIPSALDEQHRLGVHGMSSSCTQGGVGCHAGCLSNPGLSVNERVAPVTTCTV